MYGMVCVVGKVCVCVVVCGRHNVCVKCPVCGLKNGKMCVWWQNTTNVNAQVWQVQCAR